MTTIFEFNNESFIEKVKMHPVLYDLKHPDYKNIRKKDKVWDEIGREVGTDGDNAKKKWKNLRDTYSKYLRSTKTSTGQAAKKNYGHWQWAIQMEFLKTFLSFAKTVGNITESPGDEITGETEVNSQNQHLVQDESSASENIQPEREEQQGSSSEQVEPTLIQSQPKVSRKSRKEDKSEDTPIKEVIKYLQNKPQKRLYTDMDELEYLFVGHAKTVKKLSARRQAIVKMKVAQVIAEQELLHLDEVTGTNSQFSYSSPSSYSNLSDDQQSTIITNAAVPSYSSPNYNIFNGRNTNPDTISATGTTGTYFQNFSSE